MRCAMSAKGRWEVGGGEVQQAGTSMRALPVRTLPSRPFSSQRPQRGSLWWWSPPPPEIRDSGDVTSP